MEFDVQGQVDHWWRSAEEEFEFVDHAFLWRKPRQAMFHAHLSLEMALKASVCSFLKDVSPKIHDLVRLAQIAQLPISDNQKRFLGKMNQYNITGRYTNPLPQEPTHEEAAQLIQTSKEFVKWLKPVLFKASDAI